MKITEEQKINKYVGKKIREYRIKKGLTQKELGDLVGVRHNTISQYEKGINAPEQNTIFKISRVLGIRVDDLFPPTSDVDVSDELERALSLTQSLKLQEIQILKELIEKALSLDEEERAKFLEHLKFVIEFHDRMKI